MLLYTLLLLCGFLGIVNTGRILNGDIWVDYANAGSMTQLSFSFMLQNPIDQKDYIKVALPFPLHSSLVPAYPAPEGLSIPLGLEVTYQQVDQSSNIQPAILTCQVLTETIDSSTYFIRFYDSDRKTLLPIPKDQWYHLKFKILESDPLQYQKSNSILQVQMSTVSSVWSNAMVYDDNLAFNYFQLASAPTASMTLTASPHSFGSAGGYLLTQAQYSMYLDVVMSISTSQFQQNIKLLFFIDEEDSFRWTGTCSSAAKTNSPRIEILDPSLYTCSIDTNTNIMTVVLTPQALAQQTNYRFNVDIINPPIVMEDVDIVVKAVKEVSGVILSIGTDEAALKTNQIYITYQEIFVGWGLRPDALLPFDARVFRGDSATPSYMPYNSLSTKFQISQTTSSDVQLKIEINIPSESGAFVLPNGFTHNLPAFPDKVVRCVVEYQSDTIKRKIACTGVGSLLQTKVYEIGWKMFFPYDNYESDIDCTQFGLITIYTAETITAEDNVFILGRGDSFLKYMKVSPDYFVIGRNTSYISYMKTFGNLNLMILSEDFQDFHKYPEEIIVTNRPHNYPNKQYNDVYVIGQNLAFMTYLEQFDDLYIAYRLKSDSDIIKGYKPTPLIATSMPKNTLTIKTSNSKDWADYISNSHPLISSSTTSSPSAGLRIQSGVDQQLFFNLRAPYDDVTSIASTQLTIEDNWGMLIMMNPKVKLNDPNVVLTENAVALTASAETVDDVNAYNKYTLITLNGPTPAELQTSFPTTPSKTQFSLSPFRIEEFSSIFADEDNFDVMIATIDGIDGPLNRITYNGFFLINAFTLMPSEDIGTISSGFVGYAHTIQMDGSKVPTMLRLKGTIAGTTNFHTLNVFFDELEPFYENYYAGDIFCKSTDGAPFCKFEKGAESKAVKQNYQTFSRIQISLATPATAFDILIPVKAPGKSQTNFYIGYTEKDPVTGRIYTRYMENLKTVSHSGSYSTSGVYGPVISAAKVGEVLTPMTLKASYSSISQNNDATDNIGAAFLYFSEWDYFGSASISGWGNGPCYQLSYLLYETNYQDFLAGTTFAYTYKYMKGVVCFADTGTSTGSAQLTISTSTMPSKFGLNFPGWGGYSNNDGNLRALKANHQAASAAETVTSPIITPVMGQNMIKAVGRWVIPLPVSLEDDVQIIITGSSSANMPFLPISGTCGVYIGDLKLPIGCIFTTAPTQVDYILVINEPDLLPAGTDMSIMHYGLSTNATNNAASFDIQCFSLVNTNSPGANDLIFSATSQPFNYGASDPRYEGASSITLASFFSITNNKAAVTSFNFSFTVLSKGMYVTNRVRINLGQFHIDNSASQISPRCKIYTYSTTGSLEFSHDWAAIDTSQGLNRLQFWPQKDSDSTNLTYTVKCQNFYATSTSSPTSITGMVANASDLTGEITTPTGITLTTLPAMTKTNQISATKKFTVPSTLMEISFNIGSPGITTDSIMYIGFPPYYANGLGPSVKCYASSEILCKVTDRQLMIRYMGTYAEGTSFVITVTGVSQPVNYNSGTFYFVIDNDDNPTTVISSGTFIDSVSASVLDTQNFPAFQILSFQQSSNYLREQNVEITMDFFIPTSLESVSVGQHLFLVFPPNFGDILRFVEPTCTLNIRGNTLKNYISSCSVKGLRIKMPFLDDLTLGSVYTLIISGLINPTNPSSYVYKYALQITSPSGTSIKARSFSPHANFQMPIFIINPIRQSLNYYTEDDGLITQVTTTVNIQSKQVFIGPSADLVNSFYSRNVYLKSLNNLYSIPSALDLLSGQNPFPIRLSGLSSGVNFIYFSKTGDGSYYSNLPPLILNVNKNYFKAVSFIQTAFNLPVAAVNTNYSIAVNLPFDLYPMSETNLTVTLSNTPAQVGLSLRNNPTVIRFYPQKTTANIRLYISDATLWTIGRTTNLVITPANTNTFSAAATIPITASNPVATLPTASVAISSTALKQAVFDISCTQHGRFVYHISRKYPYNLTACELTIDEISTWVEQSSIDGLRVDETYYSCEDKIGQTSIVTPSTPQQLTISDLYTTTDYTLNGYCISQIGTKSEITSLDFTTLSNGGYVSKMDFTFQAPLTTAQKIKLVCALALLFQVNYYKVSTADGYYCSELLSSRLLEEIGVKKSHLMEEEEEEEEEEDDDMHIQGRLLTATPNRVQVYFGVNNDKNLDNSPASINALSVSQTEIISEIQDIVGLPNLVSLDTSAATDVGPNVFTGGHLDVGPDYVYIQGMQLDTDGLIYVIAGEASLWSRAPVISEIKQGSGPNGLPPVFYRVLAYRTAEPYTSSVAFTGFGGSTLKLYIMFSDDNPFDTANFDERIRGYTIEPEVPSWQKSLVVLSIMLLLVLSL